MDGSDEPGDLGWDSRSFPLHIPDNVGWGGEFPFQIPHKGIPIPPSMSGILSCSVSLFE